MIKLRASSLHRVMNCKGSVALSTLSPPPDTSEAAAEGTAAHEASEMILKGVVQDGIELIDRKMSNGVYVTAEMIDNITPYVELVRGWHEIEAPADWNPCDGVAIGGITDARDWRPDVATLRIADLKFGWRIVEPFENWQLISYAVGGGGLHESVERIEMSIVQPRPYHPDGPVRTWSITRAELVAYYERVVATASTLDDTLSTGTHCTYCPALLGCKAAREAGFNAVDVATSSGALETYDGSALASQLDTLERAAEMLKLRKTALEDEAKARIQKGESVPGWWVNQAFGNRAWLDGLNAETITALTGVDVEKRDVITPAQAEKRGIDAETIKTLTTRPPHGFKLIRSDGDTEARRAFANAS